MSGENEVTTAIVTSDELHFLAGYAIGEVTLEGLTTEGAADHYVCVRLKRYAGLGSDEVEEFEVIMTALQGELIQRMLGSTSARVHERSLLRGGD